MSTFTLVDRCLCQRSKETAVTRKAKQSIVCLLNRLLYSVRPNKSDYVGPTRSGENQDDYVAIPRGHKHGEYITVY